MHKAHSISVVLLIAIGYLAYSRGMMKVRVRRLREHFEVLGAIIKLVPIFVMNVFASLQRAPKGQFHNVPMLGNSALANIDSLVPVVVDASTTSRCVHQGQAVKRSTTPVHLPMRITDTPGVMRPIATTFRALHGEILPCR